MDHCILQPDGAVPSSPEREPGHAIFSAVEYMAIDISRKDPLSSLVRPGRTRRFLMQMIGMRRSPQLAAPRLEALRRMAIALRAGHEEYVIQEEARFYAAGFHLEDLVHLAAIIGADRHVARPSA